MVSRKLTVDIVGDLLMPLLPGGGTQSRLAKACALIAVVMALLGAPRGASAETWPSRPVTIVLGFAPGSMIDYVGRALANDLTATFGQPFVIETRQGGGGVLASNHVTKQPADGYTLLMTAVGPTVLRPLMDKTVTFYLDREFTPVILLGEAPNVLVANPKLGLKSVKDLVAYAKARDGKISIGHSGPGTLGQLATLLFVAEAGLDAASVSYRGTGPMMMDVLGGAIDAGFPAYNPATKEGTILAVTSGQRADFLPDVPTMKESGFDLVGGTWEAIFAPANVSREIVAKLNDAIVAFLRKPETRRHFSETGFQIMGGAPAKLTEKIVQDRAKWGKIIQNAKIGVPDN
jgi:tripartite-type tricarboxylate transporter receptor subunit TctC